MDLPALSVWIMTVQGQLNELFLKIRLPEQVAGDPTLPIPTLLGRDFRANQTAFAMCLHDAIV